METKYCEILFPLAIEGSYTYSVPEEFSSILNIGSRVVVNLGKRKLYTGIVYKIHYTKPDFATKDILSICETESIISKQQLELLEWTSNYYSCSLGECIIAAIPSKLLPSSESQIFFKENYKQADRLNANEEKILNLLINRKSTDIKSLIDATDIKNPIPYLEQLETKGLLSINQLISKEYKPIYKNVIEFDLKELEKIPEIEIAKLIKRSEKQKKILDFLISSCTENNTNTFTYEERSLLETLNASKSNILSLEKKGILKIVKKETSRFKTSQRVTTLRSFSLSESQNTVFKESLNYFSKNKPVLLHGVTSSGKTEIYIKLIERAISEGKEVLYLLPEIALTAQIIERLQEYFEDKIGIFHSKYSLNSRSEIYKKVLNNEIKIILGVRSAIFLPFKNLGLIIVDEEHESSYKQSDTAPRYNARDLSVVLSSIHRSNIILGSATPSIESFHNTEIGKYCKCELFERYGNVQLPEILIADIKDGYRRKVMKSHFHPILFSEINKALEDNSQVILFQNRRGFSSSIECTDCGWVPHCKNCNVSLTYHKFENKLVCHYCTEKIDIMSKCGSCHGENLKQKGMGTERIEDEIKSIFPKAKAARLDYDTARSRLRYEKILNDFAENKINILIGTQMITKGLDFEKVKLVGILNADNMLNFPDFRAFERSYQLMTQVSGRAGRRDTRGKVIIQTFSKDHPIIKYVIENDYSSFYKSQIEERKFFHYPPFWSFLIIRIRHKEQNTVNQTSRQLAEWLREGLGERVRGPEDPLINRISNYYIKNIHIRFEKNISQRKIKEIIYSGINKIKKRKGFSSLLIDIDVDPI